MIIMILTNSQLYRKDNWTVKESYVINSIYEYDISKANINILYELGIIDDLTYNTLYVADKHYREVKVGLMQKNREISKALSEGFKFFRQRLFETNQIQDTEVVSIKKDAVFVTRPLMHTDFGRVHFVQKNKYGLMIKSGALEVYYGYDSVTQDHLIDIKGIRDSKLEAYDSYFVYILISVLYLVSTRSYKDALGTLNSFISKYLALQLPVSAYREFNKTYMYRIKNSAYYCDEVFQEHVHQLDISYNLQLLMYLKVVLLNMYYG